MTPLQPIVAPPIPGAKAGDRVLPSASALWQEQGWQARGATDPSFYKNGMTDAHRDYLSKFYDPARGTTLPRGSDPGIVADMQARRSRMQAATGPTIGAAAGANAGTLPAMLTKPQAQPKQPAQAKLPRMLTGR